MVQNCYLRKITTVACLGIWRFIMAIELSGEHCGLNRNHKRDFKIERSAQREFDLISCRSTISDQNCTTANSITTIQLQTHFEITQCFCQYQHLFDIHLKKPGCDLERKIDHKLNLPKGSCNFVGL